MPIRDLSAHLARSSAASTFTPSRTAGGNAEPPAQRSVSVHVVAGHLRKIDPAGRSKALCTVV